MCRYLTINPIMTTEVLFSITDAINALKYDVLEVIFTAFVQATLILQILKVSTVKIVMS